MPHIRYLYPPAYSSVNIFRFFNANKKFKDDEVFNLHPAPSARLFLRGINRIDGRGTNINCRRHPLIPLSREIATYNARLSSTVIDTSGIVSRVSMVESGVLVKRKEGWKLLSGQTSIIQE